MGSATPGATFGRCTLEAPDRKPFIPVTTFIGGALRARRPAGEKSWTKKLSIYDSRTKQHCTLKMKPLKRPDLDDYVACFNADRRFFQSHSVEAAEGDTVVPLINVVENRSRLS